MNNTRPSRNSEFYRRKPNGRYELVRTYDSELMDSFPQGHTLITVQDHIVSRKLVVADHLALAAAAASLQDELSHIISKASEMRPQSEPLTPHQQDLWQQLIESGVSYLYFPSAHDIAETILNAIAERAKTVTDVPWVAEARERYEAAVALALQKEVND